MIGQIKISNSEINTAGLLTLSNWTMMPDGRTYLYLWSSRWEILTNKQFPVEGFRSSEKWQAVAVVKGKSVVIIPGCQVKAWALCVNPPMFNSQIYITGGE